MIPYTRSALAAGAALAFFPLSTLPAQAQSGVTLGSLTCVSEGSTGYIIGSSETLTCTFSPAVSDQPSEIYVGTLNSFGLDIGITGETIMQWSVLATSSDLYEPGILDGRYVGASANASFAAGAGVNVLVGGPQDGLTLQPVSVQAQEGVNAAVGVSALTLEVAAVEAPAAPVVVVP